MGESLYNKLGIMVMVLAVVCLPISVWLSTIYKSVMFLLVAGVCLILATAALRWFGGR